MSKIIKKVEMRGMPRSDLVAYFVSIGGHAIGNKKYLGEQWEVEIDKEEVCSLGVIKVPCTRIIFCVEEEALDEMMYQFRLKFLSAGG